MKRPCRSGKTTSTVSISPDRISSSRVLRSSQGLVMAGDPTLAPMAEHRDLLIGGVPRPAAEGETFEVTNPHDGSVIATVAQGGAADVDAALTCATRGFEEGTWPRLAPVERGRTLLRAAAL